MNTGKVMRADAMSDGLGLKIWVDDERGEHLTVCEVFIPHEHLTAWALEVRAAYERTLQYALDFDA